MTNKWEILKSVISMPLPRIKFLVGAIARLHNFCIDKRLGKSSYNLKEEIKIAKIRAANHEKELLQMRSENLGSNGKPCKMRPGVADLLSGKLQTRIKVMERVVQRGLHRPVHSCFTCNPDAVEV
jgi:hypothetical protein